jgi:hypothetical protein
MTAEHRVRIAALDTALLGAFCGDAVSKDGALRVRARTFLKALYARNTVPLLTWHHVEELLSHGSLDVANRRLDVLRSLPATAWIRGATDPDGPPGSFIDALIREVRAAYSNTDLSCAHVRDAVRPELASIGSGEEALGRFADGSWEMLRGCFAQRQRRSRETVAIARAKHVDVSKALATTLFTGTRRSREEAARVFASLSKSLANEIRTRGDERIGSPAQVANAFVQDVMHDADLFSDPNAYLVSLLIDPSEVHATMTMGELMDIAAFRKRLSVVNTTLRLPWAELIKRVTPTRLPSIYIEDALRLHSQELVRHPGSELSDSHLATFVAYADFNFVDKRTAENLRRAAQKVPPLGELLRHAEKSGLYFKVPERISEVGLRPNSNDRQSAPLSGDHSPWRSGCR